MNHFKKVSIIIFCIVLIVYSGVRFFYRTSAPKACTTEAKICPDGTAVSRTGPECEFAQCPLASSSGGKQSGGYVQGQVLLSPVCPVERIPPLPECAPKGYSSFVNITGVHNFFVQLHTDTSGVFRTLLPEGTYTVSIHQTTLYPRCSTETIVVGSAGTTTVTIECDSGIR